MIHFSNDTLNVAGLSAFHVPPTDDERVVDEVGVVTWKPKDLSPGDPLLNPLNYTIEVLSQTSPELLKQVPMPTLVSRETGEKALEIIANKMQPQVEPSKDIKHE